MGIDTHSLNLLRYARLKYGDLGDTITLGRLAVLLGPKAARQWAGTDQGAWCEPLLQEKFGATRVDSIDNSAYEGATIIADFNQPIANQLEDRYDTVIDFGCTEHIFDVAQSMRNVTAICKIGGLILHAVPSNGCCGHGFYQFSPELYFSWYTEEHGYGDTEIFLADMCDTKNWYRVSPPTKGRRINVRSSGEMYVLVLTRRTGAGHETIQQSDYAFTWAQTTHAAARSHPPGRFASIRETLGSVSFIAHAVYRLDTRLARDGAKTLNRHPALTRVPLGKL